MIKVVLDTNVLISAIVFGGKPRIILERVVEGRISLGISCAIIEEIRQVLGGRKFNYPPEVISSIIAELESISEYLTPEKRIELVKNDPDDNRILECADAFNSEFIISGDDDLLSIRNFGVIKIIGPAEFIKILERH